MEKLRANMKQNKKRVQPEKDILQSLHNQNSIVLPF